MTMRHGFSRWINSRTVAVFGGAAALVLLTYWLAPVSVQLAVLGLLLAAVLAILLGRSFGSVPQGTDADLLTLPLSLARDDDIFDLYRHVSGSLREIGGNGDPIYRGLAVQRTGTAKWVHRRSGAQRPAHSLAAARTSRVKLALH